MQKKIMQDSFINIIATVIPIFALQIIILPIVGNVIGDAEYGNAITLISFSTMFSLPFGNVLNNIRLLSNDSYNEENLEGDFNVIILFNVIINALIMVVGGFYYQESLISIILIIIYSSANILRLYLEVSFRLKLNYKLILVNHIVLSVGYLVGLFLFLYTGYWQMIYVAGNIFCLLYVLKHSDLHKENIRITNKFKSTSYKSLVLFTSNILKTSISYADKLLLHPLIGPTAVSIYYSATLVGKMVSMIISPLSNVFLSYLVKMKELKMEKFLYILVISVPIGLIGYVVITFVSEPILTLLYPDWAQESLILVPVTAASSIVTSISSILHPVILRFKSINWQLLLNLFTLIIYITAILFFYNHYGLIGFSIGVLVANIFKLALMIVIFITNKD